ncbi:MAG: ATP-binding protein [Mucilaginibacter sp.]|uniref:AAA family ATPase n=1 Tax=Mucilaginibacter sp. TaxID=1882438 RepID=UPI0031A44E52
MYLSDLILNDKEKIALGDLFLPETERAKLDDLLKEFKYATELSKYELPVNNKLLLSGSSGCGKTATAKGIANALGKTLIILNLSNIISAKIGETAQNLNLVFAHIAKINGVLLLDEFDQIGKARNIDDKDVGEMRRIVNTLIQLIDQLPLQSLLICATNHRSFLDPAILRRFQLQLNYTIPSPAVLDHYYDDLLSRYPENIRSVDRIYDISFAEAKDITLTSVKRNLINAMELVIEETNVCNRADQVTEIPAAYS